MARNKALVCIAGLVITGVICCVAFVTGHNGAIASSAFAVVGGIVGYALGNKTSTTENK